jgi:hypothetical protein
MSLKGADRFRSSAGQASDAQAGPQQNVTNTAPETADVRKKSLTGRAISELEKYTIITVYRSFLRCSASIRGRCCNSTG